MIRKLAKAAYLFALALMVVAYAISAANSSPPPPKAEPPPIEYWWC